jgi:hypothetical protein
VRDLKISKFLVIGEFEVPDTANSLPNCFVEGDDMAMDAGVCDRK